jgi:hypothetical protein
MKTAKIISRLRPLLALVVGLSAAAGVKGQLTQTQTVNFDFTGNYSSATTHVSADFFSASFDPFDEALGQLESFQIVWDVANTVTGTLGGAGGSVTLNFSGSLSLADILYRENIVGLAPGGGGPGGPISLSAPLSDTSLFLVSGAGVDYDQGILEAATGVNPFTVAFASPVTISVGGSATFEAITAGSVTLTYNYLAPIPEPSAYAAIFGGVILGGVMIRRYRHRRHITTP